MPVWRCAVIVFVLLASLGGRAAAGQNCDDRPLTVAAMHDALALTVKLKIALDQSGARAAIVARTGSDVSRYGLRYTHAGLTYREKDGSWTLLHELNYCGRNTSRLFEQGLLNFFLDDPHEYRALLLAPDPRLQARLIEAAGSRTAQLLHDPRYSMIAYPFATDYQNSNGWLLELIAAADAEDRITDRRSAQSRLRSTGYRPSIIRVSAIERLGASVFTSNVGFADHPAAERLKGEYSVATVESMVRYLQKRGHVSQLDEISIQATSRQEPS